MSQYVFAVNGDQKRTVITGFNEKSKCFFADLYLGDDINVKPLEAKDAATEIEIANWLDKKGIPLGQELWDRLHEDFIDDAFGFKDTKRTFMLMPDVESSQKQGKQLAKRRQYTQ